MSRVFAGCLVLCLASVSICFGQVVQNDHVYNPSFQIKAYELSAEQEGWFDNTDGEMSRFWYAWVVDGIDLQLGELDYQDQFSHGEAATGESDVTVNIRFAYGQNTGIYLLYEVRDDNWVGQLLDQYYSNDGLEFYGEQHSAEDLYGAASTYFPCLSDPAVAHQLTETFFQMQVAFGGAELTEEFCMNWYDPAKVGLPVTDCAGGYAGGDGLVLYNCALTFADADLQYGILIEVLPEENNWRRQEWFIPWAIWGSPNNHSLSGVGYGDKLGVSFGYNDHDVGQATATSLRWRNCDAFSGGGSGISNDGWGDLLFDATLQSVLDGLGCTDWACVPSPVINSRQVYNHTKAIKTEYFSADGRKLLLADLDMIPENTIILTRLTFADDRSMTARSRRIDLVK